MAIAHRGKFVRFNNNKTNGGDDDDGDDDDGDDDDDDDNDDSNTDHDNDDIWNEPRKLGAITWAPSQYKYVVLPVQGSPC